MTISEFLNARYDEEEEWAVYGREILDSLPPLPPGAGYAATMWDYITPERVLADIAAKRAIVELHKPLDNPHILGPARCAECGGNDVRPDATGVLEDHPWAMPWPCPTLRHLVQPYAEHADFDPAWRA